MNTLPANHFGHLKRLADLRRCSVPEAIKFVMANVEPSSNNWIDTHYGIKDEQRTLDLLGFTQSQVIEKIQGLPRNIRPVTDGPYLENFSFFAQDSGLIGIEAEGVSILDFELFTERDRDVLALVQDLLPPMSVEQYRVYNTFTAQYLRLVREPRLFTMPQAALPAIDAGCYVGHKALALAQFTGGARVFAFELASDVFEVLKLNIANNTDLSIEGIRAALSDERQELKVRTCEERSMVNSLTSFSQLKEANTQFLAGGIVERETEAVETLLLDDFTQDIAQLSAVHISVNGHEPEVVRGGIQTCKKTDILRVSCPFSRDGRPVRELVINEFRQNAITIFGRSGGAVIAGSQLADNHVVPL